MFRSVVNQPLVGIAIIEDGKFSFTNPKFGEIFGYSAEELLGLGPVDMAAHADEATVANHVRERIRGEVKVIDYTFRGRRKDGAEVDIELHGSVMDLGEKPVLVSVVMDVSERMRAEREMQSLYDLLREQSIHDGLTGLYNRRYLDATLERELTLARRKGHAVSVVMCDFDHFKIVNDRYGHPAGDDVLRTSGAMMMRRSRSSDISCRYGGEEFVLVMPEMPEELAYERAEQLRAEIEATPVRHANITIPVTASFGVASFPQDGKSGVELLAAADKALYAAKRGGRNQVKRFADLRPDGCNHLQEISGPIEAWPARDNAAQASFMPAERR
jgi:diguanylate cyclase (GGDEF)-like protein/PAS domain S-box-containing protein